MPQIYEVTATVAADQAAEFEKYMADEHIPEVLATGCFAAAYFAKEGNGNQYTTAYHVNTPEDLQRYLNQHTAKLRDDFFQRFGDSVKTFRRILDIVRLFPGQ
jgi:hypothetical protein